MKTRTLLAAVVTAGLLISTGCASDTKPSASNSTSQSASPSIVIADATTEEAETTASTTVATTSATTAATKTEAEIAAEKLAEYKPVITNIELNNTNHPEIKWNSEIGDEYIDGNCVYILYRSSSPNSYGEEINRGHIWNEPTDWSSSLSEGETYYYFLQFLNNTLSTSQMSDPYPYYYEKPKPDVHQYTHTFSAPNGITVIPDYTEAMEDIENGKQPEKFHVSIIFTCPSCGKQNKLLELWTDYSFEYSSNSSLGISYQCKKSTCKYYNNGSYLQGRIYSYAVQIS